MRQKTMCLIILILLFGVSITLALPADRPETGTYISDMNRDGYGLLVIYNNWTMDTVAVLTDKKVKPKLAVYLRAKDACMHYRGIGTAIEATISILNLTSRI
jgi:hypothetical protein